ncbi:hypothetical protein MBANPS3_003543 [Mucor bainieri]
MSDSSDDEYGPITASWGTQAPVEEPAKPEGWDSLVDPNVKVGPNDVGSGNLHRRGTNYKPIDEELILARRKNIQVPKQKMLEAIRETELSLGLPESKEKPRKGKPKKKLTGKPASDKFSYTKPYTPTTNYVSAPPPPSTTRPPPPPSTNGSTWANTNLVDTPFWEKKDNAPPTIQSYNHSNSKQAVDNKAWAAAVKEVVSDPDDVNDNSPTGWVIADKFSKASNAERARPAAKVTWASNNDVDNSVNDNWGTVRTQDHSENKWGYVRAGDPGKDEAQPSWTSSQPQTLTTNHQGANGDKSSGSDWQAAANNWNTPMPAEAPASSSNGNDWGSANKEPKWGTTTSNDWTASSTATANSTATTTPTPTNATGTWGSYNNQQQNGDWGASNVNTASNWGSNSTATTTTPNTYSNDQHIPSDKPSWLNSIPDKRPESQSSRFSDPYKQRYSEVPIDIPEPVNYRRDGRIAPLKTAPPPPPENSLLITIKVELSESIKVMVDIRELDDPYQLAVNFGTKNNVNSPKVIEALTKLFTAQKELGLKKKNQRLQRRVLPKNYDNVYSNQSSPNTKFSTYSRPPSAAPSPTPFTRKVYY